MQPRHGSAWLLALAVTAGLITAALVAVFGDWRYAPAGGWDVAALVFCARSAQLTAQRARLDQHLIPDVDRLREQASRRQALLRGDPDSTVAKAPPTSSWPTAIVNNWSVMRIVASPPTSTMA